MITVTFEKITCTDPIKCSDKIVKQLETKHNAILKAKIETSTVNGHVTISHKQNNHQISLTLYDKDEQPSNKHQSTFKKL